MKEIMKKATALYDELLEKTLELKDKETDLATRRTALEGYESSLELREKDLKAEEKRVKRVADVIDAETLLAARAAEVELKESQVNTAIEKFKEEVRLKEAVISKRDKDSQDTADETVATRQRLLVEVKKVEEMKAKYKEEVLAELAGRK